MDGSRDDDGADGGRRRFLRLAAFASLDPLAAASFGVGAAGALFGGLQLRLARQDDDARDWRLDATFAAKVGCTAYNDPAVDALARDPGLNSAARAVLASIHVYRDGGRYDLDVNTRELCRALDATDEHVARSVLQQRIVVNEGLSSDGDGARRDARGIRLDGLEDDAMKASLLDSLATLRFNSVDGADFPRMRERDLEALREGWASIGVDVDDPASDRDVASRFGLHVFALQQLRYFRRCRGIGGGEPELRVARDVRREMTREFTMALEVPKRDEARLGMAEDLLGSLRRPAFHALRLGDWRHLGELLDLYFGRSGGRRGDPFDRARKTVLSSKSVHRQWMSLLDVAWKTRGKPGEARSATEALVRDWGLLRDGRTRCDPTVLRALLVVAGNVGLSREGLLLASPALRRAAAGRTTLYAAYSDTLAAMTAHR